MAFDFSSFVQKYFVDQMWDRTGYNIYNTAAYAIIALAALYLIWRAFKKFDVKIDNAFWAAAMAFTVWGASIRVVTDSIDSGRMAKILAESASGGNFFAPLAKLLYPPVLQSHVLDYGWLTVTPGIYVVTAVLLLTALAVSRKLKMPMMAAYLGGAGVLLNLLVLLPMAEHWTYALVPILLALAAVALVHFALGWKKIEHLLPVAGQALDGAATWVAINWFGPANGTNYFEQHVLAGAIGSATPLGFGLFFLLKVGFATAAVYLIRQEQLDERTKGMALMVITIIGLAPGLRDLLRMLCGT